MLTAARCRGAIQALGEVNVMAGHNFLACQNFASGGKVVAHKLLNSNDMTRKNRLEMNPAGKANP